MVAKSFQKYATIGEPFEENKKQYILIKYADGHTRQVRWYSEQEYYKLYPEEKKDANIGICGGRKIRPTREVLGFHQGYITIVKGNTTLFKDWLRENGAVYRTCWGWAFESDKELPQLPAGLEGKQLLWEKVAYVDEDELRSQSAIDDAVAELLYDESPSEYQGVVGDRIEREMQIIQIIELETGYYGPSKLYKMQDNNLNVFIWITSTNKDWKVGDIKYIKGTIREHKTFKREKQTVLTRCTEVTI